MQGKNTINANGTITYDGPSEIKKGNHNGMPRKTSAYLDTDERGHIQASSLSGSNKPNNVVPQSYDLNHGSYYNMEKAERETLNHDASIYSEKIAFVSNQPGQRPDAFMINDTITYSDGNMQNIHLSFSNLMNVEQGEMNNEINTQTSDMYNAYLNPDDHLREEYSSVEYMQLMEETDSYLSNISDEYTEHIEIHFDNSISEMSYEELSNDNISDVDTSIDISENESNVSNDFSDTSIDIDASSHDD